MIRVLSSSSTSSLNNDSKDEIVFRNNHLNPILFDEILLRIQFDGKLQLDSLIVSCAPEQLMQQITGLIEANEKTKLCLRITYV